MLWYISQEKCDFLVTKDRRWSFLPDQIEVTLKDPFTGSEATLKEGRGAPANCLKQLKERIAAEGLKGFQEIGSGPMPVLATFESEAARSVDQNGCWIALARGETALLLAGSALNSVGTHGTAGYSISPSADPVGAVRAAFSSQRTPDLPDRVSFAWKSIWLMTRGQLAVPYVNGLCVLAGIFEASQHHMRAAGMPGLKWLMVGSPVYVQQT